MDSASAGSSGAIGVLPAGMSSWRPGTSRHVSARGRGTCLDFESSLRPSCIRQRPTSIAQLAVQQAKLCLHRSMESYLYPPDITCSPRALSRHRFASSPRASYQPKFSESQQMQLNWQCKVDQYMRIVSTEFFITCPFTLL